MVNLHRSLWYYTSVKDDSEIQEALNQLAEQHPLSGIDTYYGRLKGRGQPWSRKRVLRVYREMNMRHRRKRIKRVPSRIKEPLVQPIGQNMCRSMDFMHDVLSNGRTFRVLNILDDYNREAIAAEASHGFPAERVVRLLERIALFRGKPSKIRVDNGPEFTSKVFTGWCIEQGIDVLYIQTGKPNQNAFIE